LGFFVSTSIAVSFIYSKFVREYDREILIRDITKSISPSDIIRNVKSLEDRIKNFEDKVEANFSYNYFSSGEEFDNYLANRFEHANEVKVIHISAFTSDRKAGRRYYEIVDKFVKSGKIFRRIFCRTSNKDVLLWMKEDLEEYENYRYFIYFLGSITIDEMRTLGIMIIDDEEVCLGGGYITGFRHPTISIRNPDVVRFYVDYFGYLREQSRPIRTDGGKTNSEYLETLIKEKE